MSTFDGEITEIPFISVDYFGEENYFAKYFFLSHIHTDHMRGLFEKKFFNHLKETNKFVYTSELTKLMLEQKMSNFDSQLLPSIKSNIKSLDLKYPTLISKDGFNVSVSLLPSGHCAGAVMFLFETDLKRILYTGDIRIESQGLTKFKILHNNYNEKVPKQIHALYLDTTFLNPVYDWFPPRIEATRRICEIIKDWINMDLENFVFIKIPATCGSEQLFIEIKKNLNEQIFVNRSHYEEIFCRIPEMDGVYTFDEKSSRIHASQQYTCCTRCFKNNKKLQIIPSALYWTKDKFVNTKTNFIENVNDSKIRVCYSSHSSYSEIKNLLNYLKPNKIVACVENDNEFLQTFVNNYNKVSHNSVNCSDLDKENTVSDNIELPFITLSNVDDDNSSECSEDSLLLCTPPKKCPKLS